MVTPVLTRVPLVGRVTFVVPVDVNVIEFAPLVASVELFASDSVPVVVDIDKPFTVLLVKFSFPASVASVPVVGSVTVVTPVVVIVVLLAPEKAIVAAGIVNVPVVVDTVNPLIVLLVNACDDARSTRVTDPAGIVALVVAVAVKVNPNAPDVANEDAVVNEPPSVRFPDKLIVLDASFTLRVKVLPAVKLSEFASVKSNAPVPVERNPKLTIPVDDSPVIVGDTKVLFVKVSVVFLAIKVSAEEVDGKDIVAEEVVDCAAKVTVPDVDPGNAIEPPLFNVIAVGKETVTVPLGVEPEGVNVI